MSTHISERVSLLSVCLAALLAGCGGGDMPTTHPTDLGPSDPGGGGEDTQVTDPGPPGETITDPGPGDEGPDGDTGTQDPGKDESTDPGEVTACSEDQDCIDAWGPPPVCVLYVCDPSEGACFEVFATSEIPCTDDNPCTDGDTCSNGLCKSGPPRICADGNPCTDDFCDPESGCHHVDNTEPCDDLEPCTDGDICQDGGCVPGGPLDCDDGNPCTADECKMKQGCVWTAVERPCDDGDACTTGDHCLDGQCTTSGALFCQDGNPCTDDSCDPLAGCQFPDNTAACEDGDPCTDDDFCVNGKCIPGDGLGCDDGNPCTTEACEPFVGCVFQYVEGPCDDGDACTTGDACRDGACYGGIGLPLDDGNPCTDDLCDPETGVMHVNNSAACDDGNPCTLQDVCQDGQCLAMAQNPCDDGNDCTLDSCDPLAGCLHDELHGTGCDDGNGCTSNDTCEHGTCLGQGLACNDGNDCTDDVCDPATGCSHLFNTGSCDDGNACTVDDQCELGNCFSGPEAPCSDGNPCTTDSCDPSQGCVHVNNDIFCEDGNLCTLGDQCADGVCVPGLPPECSDQNPCTNDLCSPLEGCLHVNNTAPCNDGDLCTTGDSCQEGECLGEAPLDCADGNPCTDDICDPQWGCAHEDNQEPCDDGLYCTQGDSCVDGACQGGSPLDCDDGDPCTDDLCDEILGCVHGEPAEVCDGMDNDCDGLTDEDMGTTSCGQGECTVISENCQNGVPQDCVPGPAMDEACDGLDNDCDGQTDEALGTTSCGLGECEVTVPTCLQGVLQDCVPGEPESEVCDGLDNDCDGEVDEGASEGCETYYIDQDGDGFGIEDDHKCTCGPSGTYTSQEPGDCDDEDDQVWPGAKEQCNGKDDDCDNETDEDDADVMCVGGPSESIHADLACEDGACQVAACHDHWHDVNGDFMDGCECAEDVHEDLGGQSCPQAVDLGELGDDGNVTVIQGNLVPGSDHDWYSVQALDLTWSQEVAGCDHFNLRAAFLQNPGGIFRLEVYRDSCQKESQTCEEGIVSEWAVNHGDAQGGECKCSMAADADCKPPEDYDHCLEVHGTSQNCGSCPGVATPGTHQCSDNTATFYIHVFRAQGTEPVCGKYELEISNGLFVWNP